MGGSSGVDGRCVTGPWVAGLVVGSIDCLRSMVDDRKKTTHAGIFQPLLTQVDSAINIFEGLSKGNFKSLFLFDNAPSHQKQALDAISAQKMSKGVPLSSFYFIFSDFHLHRAKKWLDAPPGWATHVTWSPLKQ